MVYIDDGQKATTSKEADCLPEEKFGSENACQENAQLEHILLRPDSYIESIDKERKIKDIPKLEDAYDAGTKNSLMCTLILIEGDSAMAQISAGLHILGRDKYGVYPLKGKLLNVREASPNQISKNVEINNIIRIVGLQYNKTYQSVDDLKSLRYGKLLVMADQDVDGSHIKGLVMSFIHYYWPSLFKFHFLEQFITPVVKATKGNEVHLFYNLPEVEEWKKKVHNWRTYKIKHYKGLGTWPLYEFKEFLKNMSRHRIRFVYTGSEDDHFLGIAFGKTPQELELRKKLISDSIEEQRKKQKQNISEKIFCEGSTKEVSIKDFVKEELAAFFVTSVYRCIPSITDGLKTSQRKVLFTCFKRNDKREVNVADLAGLVSDNCDHHNGNTYLMTIITNFAQDFVGSNNINLLLPIGQFGTRHQGGKNAASGRYISTRLNPLTSLLFNQLDEPLLNYDGFNTENQFFLPIIPMVLVNGADGITSGWYTKIPNYNPRDIVDNICRMMRGEEVKIMKPWFRGFSGTIEKLNAQHFVSYGEAATLSTTTFEITELPIGVCTETYKETILENYLDFLITDYKEYHTDTTVKFTVTMSKENLFKTLDSGLHQTFRLESSILISNMTLIDANGIPRKYETPEDILREFFLFRLEYYSKRKQYYQSLLEAETSKLVNQIRFIQTDRALLLQNFSTPEFVAQLISRNYDTDPVTAWKKQNAIKGDNEQSSSDSDSDDADGHDKKYDFDYLIDMSIRNMLSESAENLTELLAQKKTELAKFSASSPEDLWQEDLRAFLLELDAVELEEKTKQATYVTSDHLPSPNGERVIPKISQKNKRKLEKLAETDQTLKRPKMATILELDNVCIEDESLPLSPQLHSLELVPSPKTKQNNNNDVSSSLPGTSCPVTLEEALSMQTEAEEMKRIAPEGKEEINVVKPRHSQKGIFPCTQCNETYQHKSSLDIHIIDCHSIFSNLRPYKCDLCNYTTTNVRNLYKHKKSIHRGGLDNLSALVAPDTFDSGYGRQVWTPASNSTLTEEEYAAMVVNATPFSADDLNKPSNAHTLSDSDLNSSDYTNSTSTSGGEKNKENGSNGADKTRPSPGLSKSGSATSGSSSSGFLRVKNVPHRLFKKNDSLLETFCRQYGQLKQFFHFRAQAIAIVEFSNLEHAIAVQAALNNYVLGNITILADLMTELEAQQYLERIRGGGQLTNNANGADQTVTKKDFFPCEKCPKVCTSRWSLKSHMKTHLSSSQKKIFFCDESGCGALLSSKQVLAAHKRLHTGKKPYQCAVCGAAYPSKQQLINHSKKHTAFK